MKEIFKDIKGYEGIYQVSNYGNVKSFKFNKERLLKLYSTRGYYIVSLTRSGYKSRNFKVHKLVSQAFLGDVLDGEYNKVVNHIDFNSHNNNVSNLELITQRENSNQKHLPSSSKYVGVHWNTRAKKWKSMIRINGKKVYLGSFTDELEASEAYQTKLNEITLG
tara:strand:+ start:76 stop:567 length:492 start_codon:yes stop_codon:yes gene_type:complete